MLACRTKPLQLTAAELTNGFRHEPSYHRAINTARDSAYDLGFVADLLPDACDRMSDEVAHDPMLSGFADVDGKVLQYF